MESIITFFIIAAVIITLVVITITIYNKMVTLKNELNYNFQRLQDVINAKFDAARLFYNSCYMINPNEFFHLNELVSNYNLVVGVDAVINASLELDKELKRIIAMMDKNSINNWLIRYNDLNMKMAVARDNYNNNVLKFNNYINMVPINFISGLFGFMPWSYFRNDDL